MQHISKWPTDKGKGWRLETETGEIIATLRGEDAKDHAAFLVKAANLYPEIVHALQSTRKVDLPLHVAREVDQVLKTIEAHP